MIYDVLQRVWYTRIWYNYINIIKINFITKNDYFSCISRNAVHHSSFLKETRKQFDGHNKLSWNMDKAKMDELLSKILKATIIARKLIRLLEIYRSSRHLSHTMKKEKKRIPIFY